MTVRMHFVGVSTASSSIMRVFPVWAELLGLDAELVGLDLPLDAAPADYRHALTGMREDPDCVGALVTTHKISLLEATRDLFDQLDPFAATVGEVSSIVFRDGKTHGSAKDPITAGLALEEVLAEDHFAGGGEVFCLGAGGAGTAIGWYLAHREDRPATMTFVDVSPSRLEHLCAVLTAAAPDVRMRTLQVSEADLSRTLPDLPAGSLIVNATGLGKDRPGSPIPSGVLLPRGSVVWELNYRGSLEFLHQARAQEVDRDLTVVDGWRYFIHGWTQVIADVFDIPMGLDRVAELSDAARSV